MRPITFALYFGNRGFFPESLLAGARTEMQRTLEDLGYGALLMDPGATPYGAVESVQDGEKYAKFLEENRGRYDGVILCLPNFGDETGAVAALQSAGVPILIQAYPDELDKMSSSRRRDAFCGKFSIMDVFCQYGIPFTACTPHTIHPASVQFGKQADFFAAVCRVVRGMKRMTVGAIGARTTPFKTVRFDELALQRHGITTETFDLSDVIRRVRGLAGDDPKCAAKAGKLQGYTNWDGVKPAAFETLVRLSVVLDDLITECRLDAIALRCWLELEMELKVSPCVLLSEINDRGTAAACEVDVCNAIAMHALSLASGRPSACLDWNNNYGDEEDKCILFHCGPVAQGLMAAKGRVIDHPMFAKTLGPGCGFGCNVGRIAPTAMTYASAKTENGKLFFYLGEGEVTSDTIPDDFFGCAGVVKIEGLQGKLQALGYSGYRHHVSLTPGQVAAPVREALERYVRCEFTEL